MEELQTLRYDGGEARVAMTLAGRRLGKRVLEARNLSKAYGSLELFSGIDMHLDRGDRIGIIGPNGAGKSTFLDILAGKTHPDTGTVVWGETVQLGYYDQESQDLPENKRVIEFIMDQAPLIRSADGERVDAARVLEWFLFPRPHQRTYIRDLSGGERRRLYLLRTLVHRPNVLLLDEPTNDLDIQTLTVLEQFLDHFQGALVVVSHDRYFLDRCVDYLIHFEDGAVSGRYPAPYDSYRRLRAQTEREEAAKEVTAVSEVASRSQQRPALTTEKGVDRPKRKLSRQEKKELTALEETIADLESRKKSLAQAINEAGDDYVRLQELVDELQAVEQAADRAMERWAELAEIAEA